MGNLVSINRVKSIHLSLLLFNEHIIIVIIYDVALAGLELATCENKIWVKLCSPGAGQSAGVRGGVGAGVGGEGLNQE